MNVCGLLIGSFVCVFCRKAACFVVSHGKFMQALNDVLNGRFFANSSCEVKEATENYEIRREGGFGKRMHLTPFFTPH